MGNEESDDASSSFEDDADGSLSSYAMPSEQAVPETKGGPFDISSLEESSQQPIYTEQNDSMIEL